jgi:catalase-peroxidase
MDDNTPTTGGKCPVMHGTDGPHGAAYDINNSSRRRGNRDWWPNQLDLGMLHQHSSLSNPMGRLRLFRGIPEARRRGAPQGPHRVMTDSQEWWPADYGHYGPFFIRMAWHAAGTYRTGDGRGGASAGSQRFAPLNSWPDNGNLDKARRLLWPIKQKYGNKMSWADLLVFTGNCAIESMGLQPFGLGFGRADIWEPEEDIYWGAEAEWLGDKRYSGDRELENPLAAVQMGLIYVNPEGPDGKPDPLGSARDIRETFLRMAMNDEETVALTAGGHTFGKMHGAGDPALMGPEPEGAPDRGAGPRVAQQLRDRQGRAHHDLRPRRRVDANPDEVGQFLLRDAVRLGVGARQEPGWRLDLGADRQGQRGIVPDAHVPGKMVLPAMSTADMAMRMDPEYAKISKRFHENPDQFADAFARAWFKLTHRDMGPRARYLGPLGPAGRSDLAGSGPGGGSSAHRGERHRGR